MSLSNDICKKLSQIVGHDSVLTSQTDLKTYSYDGTTNWSAMPDIVVFPTTTEQISEIMKLAFEGGIAVTVRGAGTCLSGGPVPVAGGIVLCTTRMNRIIGIDSENFTVAVEVGVVLNDLNQALAKKNLFFPPDPQSFLAATIGGCVSEGAGGPYAVKYGVFKHYILGMTVVLPNGTVLKLGGNTVKNVTGYDVSQLICGSEGTLAVITQVTLRLLSKPETTQTVLAAFDRVKWAGKAVHEVRTSGVLPAKIELMDNWVIRQIEQRTPLGLPLAADAILIFELDGISEAVAKETKAVIEICRKNGATEVRAARDSNESVNFWTARRAGFGAVYSGSPTILAEDVTVPVSRIADFMDFIDGLRKKYDVSIIIIGHAGDGNLHPTVLTDKNDTEHYGRAERAVSEIFAFALEAGGALSGEHGIGLEKKRFLKQALSSDEIELLKALKRTFDPTNILNPGKIWE